MKVSLYKRDGSRKWWLRYIDHEGIARRISSGTTDETVARQIADRIEAELARRTPQAGENPDDKGPEVDPLVRQIAELENLMLTVVRHQAEAQEISSKRLAELLRRLLARVRDLEEIDEHEENTDEL